MANKIYTAKQINKKFKDKWVDVYPIYDYKTGEYTYEVRHVYKDIHENSTLGQDVGTDLEYTR